GDGSMACPAQLLSQPRINCLTRQNSGGNLCTCGFRLEMVISLFRQRQVKVFHTVSLASIMPQSNGIGDAIEGASIGGAGEAVGSNTSLVLRQNCVRPDLMRRALAIAGVGA